MLNARQCYSNLLNFVDYIDYLSSILNLTKLFREKEKENINNCAERLLNLAFDDICKSFKDLLLSRKPDPNLTKEENNEVEQKLYKVIHLVKEEYQMNIISSNDWVKAFSINEIYINDVLSLYENKQRKMHNTQTLIVLFLITQINNDNNYINEIKDRAIERVNKASHLVFGDDVAKIEILKLLINSLNVENSNKFIILYFTIIKVNINFIFRAFTYIYYICNVPNRFQK